jgi:hypothetical protein
MFDAGSVRVCKIHPHSSGGIFWFVFYTYSSVQTISTLWLIPTQDHTGFTQDSTGFKNLVDFLEIYTGFHKIPQDPGNPVGPK